MCSNQWPSRVMPLLLLLLLLACACGGQKPPADVQAACPDRCACPKKRVGEKFTKIKCGGLDKPIVYLGEIPFTQLLNATDVTFL